MPDKGLADDLANDAAAKGIAPAGTDFALETFDSGQGFLKCEAFGQPGSGKTYTGTLLAVAAREFSKLEGPIAMFDTEAGGTWVNDMVRYLTGLNVVGVRRRSLADLMLTVPAVQKVNAAALVVDSITHCWREVCDSYMAELNRVRASVRKPLLVNLEFQHWNQIKGSGGPWARWLTLFLNSPLHISLCGRGGFTYAFEEVEGQDKKQLVQTGTKPKVETEFGYEPALVVELRLEQERDAEFNVVRATRKATILKDRSDTLSGATTTFDSYKLPDGKSDWARHYEAVKAFFGPHLRCLTPGAVNAIDPTLRTSHHLDADGNAGYTRERREREILCEEIEGLMKLKWPGRTNEEIKAKTQCLDDFFGTRSWTKVQSMRAEPLREALSKMRFALEPNRKD